MNTSIDDETKAYDDQRTKQGRRLRDFADACAFFCYQKAVTVDPENPMAWRCLAHMIQQGRGHRLNIDKDGKEDTTVLSNGYSVEGGRGGREGEGEGKEWNTDKESITNVMRDLKAGGELENVGESNDDEVRIRERETLMARADEMLRIAAELEEKQTNKA